MDESTTPKIPIYTKQDNALEADVNTGNYAVAVAERHPVDVLQQKKNVGSTNPYQDLHFVRSVYGSGLAMEMAAERQWVQQEQQYYTMGGHKQESKIATIVDDIINGTDTTLQYSDFMSLPDDAIQMPKSVFHTTLDRQVKN